MKQALFAFLLGSLVSTVSAADYISIVGSPVVGRVLAAGGEDLKKAVDVEFKANMEVNSARAIGAMADGLVDLAITPRRMMPEEQAARADKEFTETVVGYQSLVIIVSDDLWRTGVRALTKEQLRSLYEGDIKNWRDVGGPNLPVQYLNRSSAYGVWDAFMIFLYGDVRKSPLSKADVVDNAEELKTMVQFKSGSFSVLEFAFYEDGHGLHALGLKQPDGSVVEPTVTNVANGTYPIIRPLVFSTNRKPTGKVRELLEYLMSDVGQAIVKRSGNVTAAEVEAAKGK